MLCVFWPPGLPSLQLGQHLPCSRSTQWRSRCLQSTTCPPALSAPCGEDTKRVSPLLTIDTARSSTGLYLLSKLGENAWGEICRVAPSWVLLFTPVLLLVVDRLVHTLMTWFNKNPKVCVHSHSKQTLFSAVGGYMLCDLLDYNLLQNPPK